MHFVPGYKRRLERVSLMETRPAWACAKHASARAARARAKKMQTERCCTSMTADRRSSADQMVSDMSSSADTPHLQSCTESETREMFARLNFFQNFTGRAERAAPCVGARQTQRQGGGGGGGARDFDFWPCRGTGFGSLRNIKRLQHTSLDGLNALLN